MKKPYIYLITDKIKNKPYYVGKHNGEIKNYITGSKILRRYISIFNLESFLNRFDRTVIEYTTNELLNDREEFFIKLYDTKNNGGNLTRGGKYDSLYRTAIKKPIIQYDLEGNFIKEWLYGKDIWRAGIVKSYPDISACCLGKQRTTGGFIWRYKIDDIPLKIEVSNRKEYKKNTKRVKYQKIEILGIEYDSICDAARDLGFTFGKLNGKIKNNQIQYRWII